MPPSAPPSTLAELVEPVWCEPTDARCETSMATCEEWGLEAARRVVVVSFGHRVSVNH